MDQFSSLEVKQEVMQVLSQIWKFSQSLLAVTPWSTLIFLNERTPIIYTLSFLSFQAKISSLVSSRIFLLWTEHLRRFFFQGYYNEARILEPVTFTTITQLPNIPGAVNDCGYLNIVSFFWICSLTAFFIYSVLAGRTYPLEGKH